MGRTAFLSAWISDMLIIFIVAEWPLKFRGFMATRPPRRGAP